VAAYPGANFIIGPITEWQIDIIKENISHYCEAIIDHSQLSYQEKEEWRLRATNGSRFMVKGSRQLMVHG